MAEFRTKRCWLLLRRVRSPKLCSKTERGSLSLELVATVPILVLVVLLGIQTAIVYHARNVLNTAVDEGVDQMRGEIGSESSGRRAVNDLLGTMGKGVLHDPTVTATRNDQAARIHVKANPTSLLPGLNFTISAEAAAPVERFTRP